MIKSKKDLFDKERKKDKKVKIYGRYISPIFAVNWKLKSKVLNLSNYTRICKFSGSKVEKIYNQLLKQGHIDDGENFRYEVFLERDLRKDYWGPSHINILEEFDLICSLIGITFQGYPDLSTILHISANREKIFHFFPIWYRPQVGWLANGQPSDFAIDSGMANYLKNAWDTILKGIKERKYNRLFNAVRFYSLACTSLRESEAILDLVISLETLFAPHSQSEISHQVALNISKFLCNDVEDRKKLYRQVKKIYDDRSKIVHGNMPKKEEKFLANLDTAFDISARTLFKILFSPKMRDIFSDEGLRAKYLEELCFS